MSKKCEIKDGIDICRALYFKLSDHGVYPALTGGLLYKDGERKDIDIVLYRNRQSLDKFETSDIDEVLRDIGFTDIQYYGFVTKSKFNGFVVDIFNPEAACGDY